ncbi:MAG: hypothetical protein RLZZ591_737 [Pseudomonadota bacterium]
MVSVENNEWTPMEYTQHPYYIEAPDFDECSPSVRQLHELCNALNQLGYQAFLTGCKKTSGKLWTPLLGRVTMAGHYLAKKKPILIRTSGTKATDKLPGISVLYVREGVDVDGAKVAEGYVILAGQIVSRLPLRMPWVNQKHYPFASDAKTGQAIVYAQAFERLGGKLRADHQCLRKITVEQSGELSRQQRIELLKSASCLYAYECAVIVTEARLCGCPVVYVGNDRLLQAPPNSVWDVTGTTWNGSPEDVSESELELFGDSFTRHFENSKNDVLKFASASQAVATAADFEVAWPAAAIESLDDLVIVKAERAERSDAAKYRRIKQQYKAWREKSTLREIDGQTYAEHVASGALKSFGAAIYAGADAMEQIGCTLDSLQGGFQPVEYVVIFSPMACPLHPSELGEQLRWVDTSAEEVSFDWNDTGVDWWLLLRAGVTLETHALLEFALAANSEKIQMLYADDDVIANGEALPHFKPDINIEWIRAFNYLGSAIGVKNNVWSDWSENLMFSGTYALALDLVNQGYAKNIGHIDTVLSHEPGGTDYGTEAVELRQLKESFLRHKYSALVSPGKTMGTRLIEYVPRDDQKVSIVIPTGKQLGYLSCLLGSLAEFADPALVEIIFVTQSADFWELERCLTSHKLPWRAQIEVTEDGPYSHARALNAGARSATGDLILFADDDLECLQNNWLGVLRAYFDQPDIGCVGPRLVVQTGDDSILQSGPMVAGAGGAVGSYTGDKRLIEEQGVFSRLQLAQDVDMVDGSCFLTRASLWNELGGFDEGVLTVFNTVSDYCLRATEAGYRHVWTPVSNLLHYGGKTVAMSQQRPADALHMQSIAVHEREQMLQKWGAVLGGTRLYNRHLSLLAPYEIEADVVIDWPSDRVDRKTVLALPISSGSGQYRVIEPLNALQKSGMARTCVVLPAREGTLRTPLAVEVSRAQPDRLIVQHSISDAHFQLLKEYREVCPDLFIIQMVDDLFRDLSKAHPHHKFHQREGEVRMRKAIMHSDRLIVSTQPLADAYSRYCADVRIMPNCLDEDAWGGLCRVQPERSRLRVGWAGAAQHLGDLEMMVDVVKTLSDRVDWVFMGMCPDVLRPYISEFHSFVSYAEYPKKLASLDLDIAVAPLEDTLFNESKSNLRLLEYGAMGWPVVCSDVYPFRTSSPPVIRVKNNSDEWIDAILSLCNNRVQRLKLGSDLNQWVNDNYLVGGRASDWYRAIFD